MSAATAPTLLPYLPRVVLDWARTEPETRLRELDGTMAYVDISGFTPMSERLARAGKAGAEELTEVMNAAFARLLERAYAEGGSLLKFGGDALLVFFEGDDHAPRAARASFAMRRALRDLGPVRTSAGAMTLRLHAGVHSGRFHFVLAGDSHRELVVLGPAATATVAMEEASEAGEIVLSPATAALVDPDALGRPKGEGRLLQRAPAGAGLDVPLPPVDGIPLERYLPVALRPALAAPIEPEHRHAAVALVRFAGTDALLAAAGPEALADAVEEVVLAVQRAADEHGVCFLETFVDEDGGRFVLVAGAPATSGNDEERLLRTVRAILEARPRLQLQIGVSQGRVFAGEVGAAFRRTYTILGDTAALAARLMTRAGAGEIFAAADVLERSRTTFAAADLPPLTVKGVSQPVRAVVVGPIEGVRTQPERRQLPLVDRERERALLAAAVAPARLGFGSLVELVGDPGIGKSRLLEELARQAEDLVEVRFACEQYQASTPYFAFRGPLRSLLAVDLDGTPAANTERLRGRLELVAPDLLPWLPLLAVPLDVDVLPTPEAEELRPAFRRARLHGAVASLLEQLLPRPTLLLVEDAHWLDEASAALLAHLGAQVAGRPWLACVTRRPVPGGFSAAEASPPVPALTLRLDPLLVDDARSLAAAAAAGRELPDAELAAIAERAGGNPLFVQELVGATEGEAELGDLPESVEAVVATRIDGLAPADRALLRRASVLGVVFAGDLVAEVLADDPAAAPDSPAWDRLAEFVERDPETAGAFRFRHALIRDAAYEGLSIRRRRELHVRVAEAYERRHAEAPGDVADELSLHYAEGASWEQAWTYSLLAADRAAEKHANVEAAALYRRALEAGARIPALPPERVGRVWESLGDVSELAGRYRDAAGAYRSARRLLGSGPGLLLKEGLIREREGRYDQALRWYARGLEAAALLPDEPARRRHRIELSLALAGVKHRQGRFRECVAWCEDVVADARELDDLRPLAHAYYLLHIAHTRLGSPERDAFRGLALPIYEEVGDLLGQANVLNNLGIEAYYAGRWDEALELYGRSRSLRERAGDVVGAATMTSNLAEILSDQGLLEQATELFEQVEALTDAAGNRLMSYVSRGNRGRAAARAGRFDEAEELLQAALAGFRSIRAASFVSETEARLAELHVLRGRHEEALAVVHDALDEDAEPARRALLLRLRGYALLQAGDGGAAVEALHGSRACASAAGSTYELALTLAALAEAGAPDRDALAAEGARLLGELGVQSVPRVPLPPRK